LKTKKLVKIDEYNAAHVSQLREDLFYSSSWSMLFEDKATKLKNSIKARDCSTPWLPDLLWFSLSGKFDCPSTAYCR
jgi:hypothetical protein